MSAKGYTLNIPIQINGGEGKPVTLLPRELYFDFETNSLYCGSETGKPVNAELGDLADKVKAFLESDGTKEIKNATLTNSFIKSYTGVVEDFDALKGKEPGLYFVKVES